MGWWITLAILVLLAIMPLGVCVRYNADGVCLAVIAGLLRIRILPRKKKEKKPKKEKNPPKTKPAPEGPKPEPAPKQPPAEPAAASVEEKYPDLQKQPGKVRTSPAQSKQEPGGSWTDFLSLIPIVLDFLGDFRRKPRGNRLELRLSMAADDPCDLAINYGKAWAALGTLMPQLERFLVIRKRDLEVECDFTASQTLVTARLDLTITLGRLLAAVCKFAFRALKEYLNIMNKRKGGAVQ